MYNVLIVDDEPMILKGMSHLIKWSNYGLVIAAQASNGAQACKIMESQSFHMVITDIRMPEMDGLELIHYIQKKGLPTKCIILSGYDDFDYVKKAIKLGIENYLLKPVNVEELILTLQNTVEKIENEVYKTIEDRQMNLIFKENIYRRWVTGNIAERELLERAGLLEIEMENSSFIVAVIKDMPDRKDRKFHPQHDKNLIGFSIKNICAQIVQEHGCGICFQDFNDDVVIVFNMEGWTANENMLKDVLNQCKENMDTFLHVDGFITVGTVENNFMDITKSYMRAKHLQEFSMIYPPKTVVFSNELSLPMRYSKDVLQTDISEIKVYLSRKDSQACFEFIDRIYSKLGTAAGVTPVYIQNTTLELIIQSTSALRSLKPNTDEFLEGFPDMITSVFELRNIQEMTVWLKDMLGRFIEFLKEEDQKMSPIVRKLVGYVDSHYAKDLNLTVIALDFHVNPTYLGQLFKQETGYTFSNYLNMVRIETAKGLLKTTHLKVYEVAKHVGYLYTNYFCSIFRKLTGTSPSEYVELNNH